MAESFKFFRLMLDTGLELEDDKMRADYFVALAKYGLDGELPTDPVMRALLKGAIFSIDRSKSISSMRSENMIGNSNAVKNWETMQKQKQTETNRNKQTLSKKNRSIEDIEVIEVKEDKKLEKKEDKKKHGDFVFLTESEYSSLISKFGVSTITRFIDDLNNYIGSTGKKYKSHYYTILSWIRKDGGSAGEQAKNQALAKYRERVRNEYLSSIESNDVGHENKAQAFDRRGEVFGS